MLLLALRLYVSEHRSWAVQPLREALTAAATVAETHCDASYGRTSFTLLSRTIAPLVHAAQQAAAMVRHWPLAAHVATHPRLGMLDHISCHALTVPQRQTVQEHEMVYSAESAAELARAVGQAVAAHDFPIYYYGDAHADRRRLQDLRRSFRYFEASNESAAHWTGVPTAIPGLQPDVQRDSSQPAVHATVGICCVGAVPYIVNFNVLLSTTQIQQARDIARAVSARYGGLPGVESMALAHDEGIEVACNLLDTATSPHTKVLEAIRQAATAAGIPVLKSYTINMTAAEANNLLWQQELGLKP